MIGLRREVGGDWFNYLGVLKQIEFGDLGYALTTTDPAYGLLNWIAAQAGWGIWFPNLVCGTIFTAGLIALAKGQPNPALAIVAAIPFLVIGVAMGYTRQSAALGFIMLALAEYSRGSTFRVFGYLAVAPAFHASAVIVIPMVALALAHRGMITAILILVLAGLVLFQVAGQLESRIEIFARDRYVSRGAIPRVAMNVFAALIFLGFRGRFFNSDNRRLWVIFAVSSFATVVLLFFFPSSTVADRIAIYMVPMQIVILSRVPMAFGGDRHQNMLWVVSVIALSLLVELVWLNYGTWAHAWIPYRNYLW